MSNIDKQELREAAERAESDSWGYDRDEFNEALTPSTVLAMLDELEVAEKRIAELDGMVFSVKLPVAPLQYETLKLCLEPSDGYGMQKGAEYMRDEIIKVLHAAGIGVKGE